jgi:uncharacterized membrane protein (DUF4010 family)
MEQSELLLRLGLALAIGFLIGLERGWRERDEPEGHRTAGLRTFALVGLMGGVFGALSLGGDRLLLASGFVTAGFTFAAYMWREGQHQNDFSATSLIASMLTFLLGAFAVLGDRKIAAGTGVAAAVLLAHKDQLHNWLNRITWPELRSALLLAAMTFILLPLLPDRAIDPWHVLNPYQLWLMTVLIAAVSFGGYVTVKMVGPRAGLVLAALLGGIFASTAVTLSLARLARENNNHLRLLAGGILASGGMMFLRVLVVVAIINERLSLVVGPTLLVGAISMGILAFVFLQSGNGGDPLVKQDFALKNPFDLPQVLRFGALLSLVTLAVSLARIQSGELGVLAVAAVSGLVDVDAVTLSVARLDDVSPAAANAILTAVVMNTLAKSVYAGIIGGARLGLFVIGCSVLVTLVAAAVWFNQ